MPAERQLILEIEDPAGDAVRVLAQQCALAGGDADLVQIVPRLVAIVQSDVHDLGLTARHFIQHGAHSLDLRQVARRGHFRTRRRGFPGIHRVNTVVLVPQLVLHVEHEFAVPAPEIPRDGTLGVVGNGLGRIERRVSLLDPDIAGLVQGLQKSDVLTIGRDLRARDLRIAEEQFAIDQRRSLRGSRRKEQQDRQGKPGHGCHRVVTVILRVRFDAPLVNRSLHVPRRAELPNHVEKSGRYYISPAQTYFQQRPTFRGPQLAISRIYSDAACCDPTKLLAWASSGRAESWPLFVDLSNVA